jgi:hypothetical protein
MNLLFYCNVTIMDASVLVNTHITISKMNNAVITTVFALVFNNQNGSFFINLMFALSIADFVDDSVIFGEKFNTYYTLIHDSP